MTESKRLSEAPTWFLINRKLEIRHNIKSLYALMPPIPKRCPVRISVAIKKNVKEFEAISSILRCRKTGRGYVKDHFTLEQEMWSNKLNTWRIK